jgi:anti-sigma28 factor (negative regulator of flagellin synthesis)
MNRTPNAALARPDTCQDGVDTERLRRIDELKQKIRAGTYLINKYEIIDGLINELAAAAVPTATGE